MSIASLSSMAYREVESIVETWTKKYQYHISLLESKPNQVKFMVEFSLPQPLKPVPVATIRVYFTCSSQQKLKITFRFQKDSLIHYPNKTIRHQEIQVAIYQLQKWIDDALAKKLLVRNTVFYLGTSYESTRVEDVRQDNVLRQPQKIEQKQYIFIHPDLLSDQQRHIQIMQAKTVNKEQVDKQLKKYFYEVDKDKVGVITQNDFKKLMVNLGIKIKLQQQKQLLNKIDPQDSGMIQYQIYKQYINQFFQGLQSRDQALQNLQNSQEQQTFGSILMLINDQSQDITDLLIQKFKAKDQDETGKATVTDVKNVFDEINKSYKQQGKVEPLSVIQLSQITKNLTTDFGYKDIPYNKIHNYIIDLKIKQLSKGRINSKMNNLQIHIQDLFGKFDDKKIGKIKLQKIQQALNLSDKLKLTKTHIYLLKSLLLVDGKGDINYNQNSKFIAELIKKFYITSSKKKQLQQN